MKKLRKILLIVSFFTIVASVAAQTPPHPNGGNDPGSGNTPVGGGAPIGGGMIILSVLGAAYGARKAFQNEDKN